ncbi:MAG: hypothetical protein ACTSV7_05630, partial [Candidatus Baldrarchaeia archaeon]
ELGINEYPLNKNMFPSLYYGDPHIGTNFIGMTLVSAMLNLPNIGVLLIFGIFNIIFLLTSLYTFAYQYSKSRKIALTSIIISLIFTSAHRWVATGLFSITDIMVIAHYPALFALSIFFLLLSLNIAYLNFPQHKLLLLQLVLFFTLFTSHMLTGFIYILVLFLLLLTQCIKAKRVERKFILPIFIILITLIVAALWPFYNWWEIFLHAEPVQTSPPPIHFYSYEWVSDCLRLCDVGAIIFLFGIFSLVKRKDIFLLLWIFVFLIISLSFILPFRPPLYWRFVPFIKIPVIIGFSTWLIKSYKLGSLKKKSAILLLLVLITSVTVTSSIKNSITPLLDRDDVNKYRFLLEFNGKGKVVLTYDAYESYIIQGITNFSVVIVPWDHCSNVLLWPELEKRSKEIQNAYEEGDLDYWEKILEKYDIDYVLVSKYCKAYNSSKVIAILLRLNGIVEYSGRSFELVKVR